MGGRAGGCGAPQPVEISDGKIDGANVSFAVKVEFNGQTRVTTYSGTLSGDELKLKQTRQGRNGEQPRTSRRSGQRPDRQSEPSI